MAKQVKRKPVPLSVDAESFASRECVKTPELQDLDHSAIYDDYLDEDGEALSGLTIAEEFQPITPLPQPDAISGISHVSTASNQSKSQVAQAKLKTAYEDVRHFAGGLISHPYESTKHYSILRHSHGLVYYSGSYTNIAISVFADQELPSDRSFWLQRKGWSGKTGLKAGVLFGTKGAWIDVTPSVTATADQLKPSDERAWQRDIKKFLEKAPKQLQTHSVRETEVLRIPCQADDGYLRVVMCAGEKGKKFLCPSPVFRLASTSTASSSIRGASLATLPMELGIRIGSVVAANAAKAALSPAADAARSFVAGQVSQIYQPSALTQVAAKSAYGASGVQHRVKGVNERYDSTRDALYQAMQIDTFDALARPDVIGDDGGPTEPFPVRFQGQVVEGTGKSTATLNVPTANLTHVDDDILLRHSGVFFGWATIALPKKLQGEISTSTTDWYEAMISIIPCQASHAAVIQKKIVRVYVLHDFEGAKFFDAKLSIMMMGFLHPALQEAPGQEPDIDAQLFDFYRDIAVTMASLSRSAWAADETLERIKSADSSRSLTERAVDLRENVQKQIDKVPVHKLGVRTNSHGLKDRLVGIGGICVPRS